MLQHGLWRREFRRLPGLQQESGHCQGRHLRAGAPSSITCRTATGECDVAETCTGSTTVCPLDSYKPSSTTCLSGHGLCDGKGACKKVSGQTCSAVVECFSGLCVDGRCCAVACKDTCKTCNLKNKEGTCSNVPLGQQDQGATSPCTSPKSCNGTGACLLARGQACTKDMHCSTDHCIDYLCCDTPCLGRCKSCSVPGNKGTCSLVPAGQEDANTSVPCTGSYACDGLGKCKSKTAQSCTKAITCVSGHCVDKYCCPTACSETCKSCGLPGIAGFCVNIPQG